MIFTEIAFYSFVKTFYRKETETLKKKLKSNTSFVFLYPYETVIIFEYCCFKNKVFSFINIDI